MKTATIKTASLTSNNGSAKVEAAPKAKRVRRDYPRLSAEDFVRAYCTASSIAAMAEATGIPADAIRNRAVQLRKAGVPLKKFPRVGGGGGGRAPLDVAALTRLAESLTQ